MMAAVGIGSILVGLLNAGVSAWTHRKSGNVLGWAIDGFFRGSLSSFITGSILVYSRGRVSIWQANAVGQFGGNMLVDLFEGRLWTDPTGSLVDAGKAALIGAVVGFLIPGGAERHFNALNSIVTSYNRTLAKSQMDAADALVLGNTLDAFNLKMAGELAASKAARDMAWDMGKQLGILGAKNVAISSAKIGWDELKSLYQEFAKWLRDAQAMAQAVVDEQPAANG